MELKTVLNMPIVLASTPSGYFAEICQLCHATTMLFFWWTTTSVVCWNKLGISLFLIFQKMNQKALFCFPQSKSRDIAGGTPPDPLGRLRRRLGSLKAFRAAEPRFLLLFPGKRRIPVGLKHRRVLLGHAPRPPGSASPKVGQPKWSFREAEPRFLLLFPEKEEYHSKN
jgi:hypothetical protein